MQRRAQAFGTLVLVVLAPVLVTATMLVLGPFSFLSHLPSLRVVLLADLIYIFVVAVLVMLRIRRMIGARRSRSAGARLHLRLSGLFAVIALLPAITVAVFAVVTINLGLEGWFSDRVHNVVGTSLAAAEAYQAEQERNLIEDASAVAATLEQARRLNPLVSEVYTRQILSQAQAEIQRGLRVAFIIDFDGTLRLRGERSYLFDFIRPETADLVRASAGDLALIKDWPNSEFRALVPLPGFPNRLLYVARAVDGQILSLLDETQQTIQLYNQLEAERGTVLFNFRLALSRLRADHPDPGGGLAGDVVCRGPVAPGGPSPPPPNGWARAIWMCRCPNNAATTKSPAWGACSTR